LLPRTHLVSRKPMQYALEKQVFINKFQIPQFTRRA
jgi:hypothetical protein